MGASKRLAELIVQSFNQNQSNIANQKSPSSNTIFTIVRFGNVLCSSGSVVPLFDEQISNGGPVTITHPEIIRYFMSIEEAVNLVLNSTFLSKGRCISLRYGKTCKNSKIGKTNDKS